MASDYNGTFKYVETSIDDMAAQAKTFDSGGKFDSALQDALSLKKSLADWVGAGYLAYAQLLDVTTQYHQAILTAFEKYGIAIAKLQSDRQDFEKNNPSQSLSDVS